MDWSAKLKEIAQQVAQAEQQAQSWQARIVYLRGQRDLCAEELKKVQEAEGPHKEEPSKPLGPTQNRAERRRLGK